LPGEQVKLFTSDRHTKWSYDSDTSLSYRNETTSEESYFTFAMAKAMSDLNINESGSSQSSSNQSWADGGGGASLNLGFFSIGGGGGGSSYDASSAASFAHNLSQHADASSSNVAAAVRAASSTAIGNVDTRTHAQGESEDQYESSSRTFSNPNKCRAVTYIFYKINKLQIIRFKLVGIERIVRDPAAPTVVYQRAEPDLTGGLTVYPARVAGNSKSRLEIEKMARASVVAHENFLRSQSGVSPNVLVKNALKAAPAVEPMSLAYRNEALAAVDKDLIGAGVLDAKTGKPAAKLIAELSWEKQEVLPTPGILVKGCLDTCQTCEPALQKEIELNLEHKRLENELLKRQIELLDKAQEYRCCPSGETETPPEE
jgi:hypothetical protein